MTEANNPAAEAGTGAPQRRGDLSDVVIAAIVGGVIYAFLIWFVALGYDGGRHALGLLLALACATSVGWGAGILLSPYNIREKGAFQDLSKLVYGFLSGYVISKIDPLIASLTEGVNETRLVYFSVILTGLIVSVVFTYVSRSYWHTKSDGAG
jgi:hypothetical protein